MTLASNAKEIAVKMRYYSDKQLSPEAQSHALATFARNKRDELIEAGQASPDYVTAVDGRRGADEDSVKPNGVIFYSFNTIGLAIQWLVERLAYSGPVRSGRYRAAWRVIVDGELWSGDYRQIPPRSVVDIVNTTPYARKLEVGHMRVPEGRYFADQARRAAAQEFPSVQFSTIFMEVGSAYGGGYILKGHFRRGVQKTSRRGLYTDTQRGSRLTYPGIECKAKFFP